MCIKKIEIKQVATAISADASNALALSVKSTHTA
jgi:hypothetical protein